MWSNCSNAATSMAQMAAQIELERKQRAIAAAKGTPGRNSNASAGNSAQARSNTASKPTSQRKFLAGFRRHGTHKTASTWKDQMSARKKVFKDVSVAEVEESSSSNSTSLSVSNVAGVSSTHHDLKSQSSDSVSLESVKSSNSPLISQTATTSSVSSFTGIETHIVEEVDEEDALCTPNSERQDSENDPGSEGSVCSPDSFGLCTKGSPSPNGVDPNSGANPTNKMSGNEITGVLNGDKPLELTSRKDIRSNEQPSVGLTEKQTYNTQTTVAANRIGVDSISPAQQDCGNSLTNLALEQAGFLRPKTDTDYAVPLQGSLSNLPTITIQTKLDDDEMTQLTMDESCWGEADTIPSTAPIPTSSSSVISDMIGSTDSVQLYKKSRGVRVRSNSGQPSAYRSNSEPGAVPVGNSRLAEILSKEIWSSDNEILKMALETITEVVSLGAPEQKMTVVQFGCISSVLRVIETQPSEVIQVFAIRILERLASDPQNGLTIAEMGGICTLSSILRNQHKAISIQRAVCRALDMIARYCEDSSSSIDHSEIPTDGTVEALATCMTTFPDDVDIQAHAFSAIATLCICNPQAFDEFVRVDALQAMAMALSKKWKSKSKKSDAITAMANLMSAVSQKEDDGELFEIETALNDGSDCDNSSMFGGLRFPTTKV